MWRFILRRCLWLLVTIVAAGFIIFTILYFNPQDPALAILGSTISYEEANAFRENLGINRPYLVQLGEYMFNTFLRFDFGISWTYNVPVYSELLSRLPRTLAIGLIAMVLNVVLGLSMGIFAGTHGGKWQDSLVMAIAMIFISCPDFWVALMMVILFSSKLGWLPAQGIGTWKHYVMPIIASSFGGIAVNSRQTRSSILEVFRADFITTARAKGQRERKVILGHMLPNALMPVITGLGGALTRIVAGSAVIESIFSIPGVGNYMLVCIQRLDFPGVRACVLFFAAFSSIMMLFVDLVYGFIDPRIKAQYASGRRGK